MLRIYDDEVQAMQSARNVNGVAIYGRLAGQSERLKVFVMKQLLHLHSYVNAFLFAHMCTFINNSQSVLQKSYRRICISGQIMAVNTTKKGIT